MVPFARDFDVADQFLRYGVSYDALVMVTSSQSGKTDTLLDAIGATLDQRPAPIMYLGPTKEWLNTQLEPRIMELLLDAKRLRERLALGKRMTRFRKLVGGVPLVLAWAGSASQVAGMAAKIAVVDELDRMDASIEGEGDPFTLLEARGFSYRDRIRAAISTPLIGTVDIIKDEASGLEFWGQMPMEDIGSPIWRHWQRGTRHHYCWPCPECGEFFVPRFKILRWDGWPEVRPTAEVKRTAYLECPHCGGVIEERHKREMNARGAYVAPGQTIAPDGTVTGDPPATTILSRWVSGLCSPFVTFGERAAAYMRAKEEGNQEELQSVMNTGFGELFAPGGGDVPEWEEVAKLRRDYGKLELPAGARLLTLAADVQSYGIYYTIRAWGAGGTSWLVDYDLLHGQTVHEEVWHKLAVIVTRPIDGMTISTGLIDSGYRPGKKSAIPLNMVYKFCRRFPRRIYPSKGKDVQDKPVKVSKAEVKKTGEVHRYGLDLIWINTDETKRWVHERIRREQDRPGAWLLPHDVDDDYCKQIVSEARVMKPNGRPEWVARSRNNHYLDCEGQQAALALWMRMDLIRGEDDQAPQPEAPAAARPSRRTATRQRVPVEAPAAPEKSKSADASAARKERVRALAQRMARMR